MAKILLKFKNKALEEKKLRETIQKIPGRRLDLDKIKANRVYDKNDTLRAKDLGDFTKLQRHYEKCRTHQWTTEKNRYQISRIKWDVYKKKFFGMEFEMDDEGTPYGSQAIVELTEAWMKENFSEEDIQLYKTFAEKGKNQFLQTPVEDTIEIFPTMDISNNPGVQYRNNESGLCAFASLASALFFLGRCVEAEAIMKFSNEQKSHIKVLQSIVNHVCSNKAFKKLRKQYQFKNIGKIKNILDTKLNDNEIWLVVLKQSDNHESHAVCIVNGFIFDSNTTNALPFTKEGLDCCCGKTANFLYVANSYCLTLKPRKSSNCFI